MTPCEWLPVVEPISTAFAVVGGLFAIAWALRGIFGKEPIMRDCHIHGTACEDGQSCPDCVVMYDGLPSVETMTVPQRIAEFRMWCGVTEINFGDIHKRIEQLVGRPVWTHELVSREALERQIVHHGGQEAADGAPASP